MLPAALFTFGYEGLTIEAFIERLGQMRVEMVVDVRELPLSRKRGFSKRAFRERLAASGIHYEHLPALGCPKPIRDQYRADGDWSAYTSAFLLHLRSVTADVRSLASTAQGQRACLVCYEADHDTCHRTYVARAARAAGAPAVQHLSPEKVTPDVPNRLAA